MQSAGHENFLFDCVTEQNSPHQHCCFVSIGDHVKSCITKSLRHVQEEADWATAKRVLGQPKFIERLMTYDADNIPDAVLEALQRVVSDAHFTADQVCLTQVMPQSDNCRPAEK